MEDEDKKCKMKNIEVNANILQTNIQRMAANSNLIKSFYIPFLGVVLGILFATALSSSSDSWFYSFEHRLIFGFLVSFFVLSCSIVFMILDNKYLTLERKLRSIYKKKCVDLLKEIQSDKTEEKQPITLDLIDIGEELKHESDKCGKFRWSVYMFYPILFVIVSLTYFAVICIIELCS